MTEGRGLLLFFMIVMITVGVYFGYIATKFIYGG